MFLILTNASSEHVGKPISINTDKILSIYRTIGVDDGGAITEVTNIFCPPHGVWNVQETTEEIVAMINGEKITPKKTSTKVKTPRSIKKSEE